MTERNPTGKPQRGARSLADLIPGLLDPLFQKRAGLSTALLASWPDIVGQRFADTTCPVKVAWSRRADPDDPFAPATLVVQADPAAALAIQHETPAIVARVNGFFGYPAIDRIRVVQRVMDARAVPHRVRPGPAPELHNAALEAVPDDGLRAALARLGGSIRADAERSGRRSGR